MLFVTWTYVINDCPDTPMGEIPEEQCNSIGSASVVRAPTHPHPRSSEFRVYSSLQTANRLS